MIFFYEIAQFLLIIGFGIMMIYYRNAWASLLSDAEKNSPIYLRKEDWQESEKLKYGKKLTVIVGVAFILFGIFSVFKITYRTFV